MTYDFVTGGSDGKNNGEVTFYLYPNTSYIDPLVKKDSKPVNALESLCNQLIDAGAVSTYNIKKSLEHPDIQPYNDASDANSEFKDYDGPNNKTDIVGCHMLLYVIDTKRANGSAQVGVGSGGAFYNSVSCTTALSNITENPREKNLVIHEACHTLIDSDGYGGNEHELGTIYSGFFGDGPSSPMAGGYENAEARNGSCSSDAPWNGTNDETLTNCTINAIDTTGEL